MSRANCGPFRFNKASVIVLNDDQPRTHNFHAWDDEDWLKFYDIKAKVAVFTTAKRKGLKKILFLCHLL